MRSEIYNEDCYKTLRNIEDSTVDLIVTSPPYNIGKEYEKRTALNKYISEQKRIITECHRVLKDTGSIFWQVGSYSNNGSLIPLDIKFFPIFEDLEMIPINRIIWVRQHGLHARNKFSARHETILWFSKTNKYKFSLDEIRVPQKYQNKRAFKGENKGQLTCNPEGKNPGDIWLFRNVKHNHEEQTIHPCQFPEDLITRIVLSTTEKGDVVFDPYMGTGTVPVVCKDHNRIYIASELDKKYFNVAKRRISGLPDEENTFPNLKSLRNYIEMTGNDITDYRFDMQKGEKASPRKSAKIYSEQYHLNELLERLNFEEKYSMAQIYGTELPDDSNFVKKPIKQ